MWDRLLSNVFVLMFYLHVSFSIVLECFEHILHAFISDDVLDMTKQVAVYVFHWGSAEISHGRNQTCSLGGFTIQSFINF